MGLQFRFAGPALEVELNHLQGAHRWLAANPQTDQQAGDDRHIDLDSDARVTVRQQVPATQDAFEPAEEEFHAPAITVGQSHQLGSEVEAAGRQQQDLRTALGVGRAGSNFQDAQVLLEDAATLGTTEPNDAVAAHAGRLGLGRQRPFGDDGPDRMGAEAADEVAFGVDDVLEELLLGITAVDDVEALGLQSGPQLRGFGVVGGGHGGLGGHAFEHVEMDVHFGGAVLGIEPQGPGHFG